MSADKTALGTSNRPRASFSWSALVFCRLSISSLHSRRTCATMSSTSVGYSCTRIELASVDEKATVNYVEQAGSWIDPKMTTIVNARVQVVDIEDLTTEALRLNSAHSERNNTPPSELRTYQQKQPDTASAINLPAGSGSTATTTASSFCALPNPRTTGITLLDTDQLHERHRASLIIEDTEKDDVNVADKNEHNDTLSVKVHTGSQSPERTIKQSGASVNVIVGGPDED